MSRDYLCVTSQFTKMMTSQFTNMMTSQFTNMTSQSIPCISPIVSMWWQYDVTHTHTKLSRDTFRFLLTNLPSLLQKMRANRLRACLSGLALSYQLVIHQRVRIVDEHVRLQAGVSRVVGHGAYCTDGGGFLTGT